MDHQLATSLWQQMWQGLRGNAAAHPLPTFVDNASFPAAFAVSELAATSIGLATQATAALINTSRPVEVNVRLASRWFQHSFMPLNRPAPAMWDAFAGDYASRDGWIRLHTNAAHHRQAMERVLGQHADRRSLAREVQRWSAGELEQAIVDAGGCAAEMRSTAAWQQHPQGQAVAQEPLFAWQTTDQAAAPQWQLPEARPLLGIRVLDLTRIIAGPVATRFLASLGADVLRIDPPGWQEPSLDEEITCGKRRAVLDLTRPADREQFSHLLREADVLVHGYRADALERLGFDAATRQALAPGLVDVSLNAWGWQGPWRNRRGFDSLVQMSSGIAEAGQRWKQADKPTPLPVQALDHATGYLMAASALRLLTERLANGRGGSARLSLARTAKLLIEHGPGTNEPLRAEDALDQAPAIEQTAWGPAQRLRVPVEIGGTPVQWDLPATDLGSHRPRW